MIDETRITPQWLAGFFDGEGCISCYLQGDVMKLDVYVAQSNLPLIRMIGKMFNENPRVHSKSRKICYSIHFTGRGCKKFLEYIKDHSIVKHQQILMALEFVELIGNSGFGASKDPKVWERRNYLGAKIRSINQLGNIVEQPTGGVQ